MKSQKTIIFASLVYFCVYISDSAKINTPRVLLPWFEDLNLNFTFEIIEGGCYTWTLSRDDIIDLEPLYDDTWDHCSRAARVSVSKTCAPPGSVIILAEEPNTGEILRGDVDIDRISLLKVTSTTWKLYLEEAPEAFEVVAYDDQGNKFSTLEGIGFTWSIENIGSTVGEDLLVTLVRWRDTGYEAPRGVSEIEDRGLRGNTVLLYGQAMGECRVNVCLGDICTDFKLKVVASVVLTPATAMIALGDTLSYRVVRARAGRLTIQDIAETLYYMKVSDTGIALLEDSISLVRGTKIGTTAVRLMSGATEVATATLTVVEPYTIRVNLRPANLVIRGEMFQVHCILLDGEGHALTAGHEILIRLSVEGQVNVDLVRSTENGTLTDAVAQMTGPFTITARLHSIAGRSISRKVEGQTSGLAVDPLQVIPSELYVAWTDTIQDIPLKHIGGGDETVVWSESETLGSLSLAHTGVVSIRGAGDLKVRVQLQKYPHVQAYGRVWSAPMEMLQVSSSGYARVGRPHQLHIALTATHPNSGELYNFHVCNCASFAVSLLEGPEPHNVTAAPWVEPIEGACCVLECTWSSRGVSSVRVSRGRAGDSARVVVRAAPTLLWPPHAAALTGATLPVLAEGEALVPESSEPRTAELVARDGSPPHRHPDIQMFTLKCRRKGDTRLELTSHSDEERESVQFEAACAPYVSRIRLEPPEAPGNCSGGPKVWLRPGQEISVKVTLLDAIGRELLDERGPKVSWNIEPSHRGIQFRATDRLFIETHPEYAPVPVPNKYYQLVVTDEQAIGWTGALTATIPEATARVQAKVVAPLKCDPLRVNLAWDGEVVGNIALVSGGSGRYLVEAPTGVTARVDGVGALSAVVPGPGSYDLMLIDQCIHGERQRVEVNIEDVLNIEVSTSRAVCVGACIPISVLVKGTSHRYLTISNPPEWSITGSVVMKNGTLCGLKEGTGKIRAFLGGLWSPEVEVIVFPPLEIVPAKARVPPGGRLQLRHTGGPPQHLAGLQYKVDAGVSFADVTPSGSVNGLSKGTARIKLVATDIANVEMASALSEVEVIPISGIRVRAATQTLLVGSPGPAWVEAGGLPAASLAAVHPPPRVTWTVRDSTVARLYTTHADDYLERSVAEGLSVRVVPLKPGVITIDVRVRNIGQVSESRSWDSTIEILGISDIRTSVEGLSKELASGDRLALAVGTLVKLKALPRGSWKAYEDGAFMLSANGEVKAIRPGHGIILAQHKDERNNIYRETAIHVEVSVPHYCTAEPSGDMEDAAVRLVMRNSVGRELLAPDANISAISSLTAHLKRSANSTHGNELVIAGLDATGAFMSFQGTVSGVTVGDEVWVTGSDSTALRIVATGGWGVCLDGVGWRAPHAVRVYVGAGVTLALLVGDTSATHVLRLERTTAAATLHQLPLHKIEFLAGEWPSTLVPLSIEASGLKNGPLICTEEQRYALEGVPVELPFSCRTKQPHTAEPVLDIINGQMGCKIVPAAPIIQSSEVELCAEWSVSRTCTKVQLLPSIKVSQTKVSLLSPPAVFTVYGHPHALKLVMMTTSPGLKLESIAGEGEITVTVSNEASTCGLGWINVKSRLTAQEIRVEVERDCDVACGTLLGAFLSLITPYLSTLLTIAAVAGAYYYMQYRFQHKALIRMPMEPIQTVLPPQDASPPVSASQYRARTFSRSPYASSGPTAPVYGDASVLPDSSFSPNSTRTHSRFL